MTTCRGVEIGVAAGWQTLAVVVVSSIIGRWAAGAGFGYTLFAVIWGPILAAVWAAEVPRSAQAIGIGGAVGFLMSWPVWAIEPWRAALGLTVALTVMSANGAAMARALAVLHLPTAAIRTVAAVGWLTWVGLPCLRPDAWPEPVLARVLVINPIFVLNAVSATAGDWTHQAVAYHWLTRLGQDVAFDWPASWLPAVVAYVGTIVVLAGTLSVAKFWNVPRGTIVPASKGPDEA